MWCVQRPRDNDRGLERSAHRTSRSDGLERVRALSRAMRVLAVIEAPRERIRAIINRQPLLEQLFDRGWMTLVALESQDGAFYQYDGLNGWTLIHEGRMISLTLHLMKEIKIVVQGEHAKFVTDLLDRVGATGYTIINNVSGKGHHGFHEGHLLFNDTSSQVIVFTVVPEERVEPILAGLGPLFNKHSGAMFVTDVAVSRREHFAAK